LPVLDKSIVICGDHPVVVVTPLHGANCSIVRLQYN
jgi:hypothetical protein